MLFLIKLDTRRVDVAGITANPAGVWVVQQSRNLSMVLVERARPVKLLVRDQDAKFIASFDEVFRSEGIRIIRTPVRAPRAKSLYLYRNSSVARHNAAWHESPMSRYAIVFCVWFVLCGSFGCAQGVTPL